MVSLRTSITGLVTAAFLSTGTPVIAQDFIDDFAGTGTAGQGNGGANSSVRGEVIDLKQRQEMLYEEGALDEGQEEKGVRIVDHTPFRPVMVHIRNNAETVIFFPEDEVIEDVYLGEDSVFSARFPTATGSQNAPPTRRNVLLLRLKNGKVGGDTNMTAVGRLRSDNTRKKYLFYLSGWAIDDERVTDFFVFVQDKTGEGTGTGVADDGPIGPINLPPFGSEGDVSVNRIPEYLPEIKSSAADIRLGDYVKKVPEDADYDESLDIMPLHVWHDGIWTYLDFGEKRYNVMLQPIIRKVVDEVGSSVDNWADPERPGVVMVHSVGRNLYLRNGLGRVVCLIWVGGSLSKMAGYTS